MTQVGFCENVLQMAVFNLESCALFRKKVLILLFIYVASYARKMGSNLLV